MEMARKPRLEFAGAIYHVLSRGNCGKELFDEGSAKLFEKTLFEVCRKCEAFLHAYVIMNNHYYLAVETPEGNLVEGGASWDRELVNRTLQGCPSAPSGNLKNRQITTVKSTSETSLLRRSKGDKLRLGMVVCFGDEG